MTSSAVQPFYDATEAVVINTIRIIQPLLTNVTDEIGNPQTVPVRSIRALAEIVEPEVTVALRLGSAPFQLGRNLQAIDYDGESVDYGGNTGISYGFLARGSHLVLSVYARSDAERHFIADNIVIGIVSSYALKANSTEVWEAAVADEFAGIGVVLRGVEDVHYDMPVLSAARPHGQMYVATIDLLCDIWITWTTDGWTPQEITVQPTVTTPFDANPSPAVPDTVENPLLP